MYVHMYCLYMFICVIYTHVNQLYTYFMSFMNILACKCAYAYAYLCILLSESIPVCT